MRAAVFGAGGMLGVALILELERRGVESKPWPHAIVDITNAKDVDNTFVFSQPDVVFNAAGVLNTSHDGPAMVRANALGPHVLAKAARVHGVPVIHVSTDCVFSGDTGSRYLPRSVESQRGYTTDHPTDPNGLYGRTKVVGEVEADHVTNVRTSFVGPDHGLWRWVVGEAKVGATIIGWARAMWSGSTVWAVASGLADLVDDEDDRRLVHLATEKPISKYEAIVAIAAAEGLEVEIISDDFNNRIDRALAPTHVLPSLADALATRP